jgi:hypothetical protein
LPGNATRENRIPPSRPAVGKRLAAALALLGIGAATLA